MRARPHARPHTTIIPRGHSVARSLHDQVLALAGVFQSACLVQQLAREGRTDSAALRTSIQSILALDAPDVETIYGGARGVRLGCEIVEPSADMLRALQRYIDQTQKRQRALAR